jgi:O-antigen ligase
VKHNPLIGVGLGRPYEFVVPLPDVTEFYELEPYAPHNSIMGLWAYTGYVGFALHWASLIVVVFLSVRILHFTRDPEHRTVALICLATVVVYMVHLYGDLALGTWASVFLVSAAMVLCGKLAVQVGAWPGMGPKESQKPTQSVVTAKGA